MEICALILALLMVFFQGAMAEALLPSVGDVLDVRMPSLSCALDRYPDKDETQEDGSNVLTYNGVTEEQFNEFSEYLSLYGCTMADYSTENGKFEATVEYQGKTFSFTYDAGQQAAIVTYPQGTLAEELDPMLLAQVGDIVGFGHYEQDNNLENGQEEISWIVMDKGKDSCTLLSLYGLDTKPFHNTYTDSMTWSSCDLRTWLNDSFYNTAFDDREKNRIVETAVSMRENPAYIDIPASSANGGRGENTKDRIYIPSVTELITWFPDQAQRGAQATPYAIAQGAYTDAKNWGTPNSWYWLRTRDYSNTENCICRVGPNGTTEGTGIQDEYGGGDHADESCYTVRPMMNVRYIMSEARATLNMRAYFANNYKTIAGWNAGTIGLQNDGTVIVTGSDDSIGFEDYGWTDIVSVAARKTHTIGLRSDGTVVTDDPEIDVSGWTDIVDVDAGDGHFVGLRSDGTVVAVGRNKEGQCNVTDWNDIIDVAAGGYHTVGLRSDGTVVAVGQNSHYGDKDDPGQCEVTDWTDIIAVAGGDWHTVGLRKDGTVVATGANDHHECNVSRWTNIVAISAGVYHTVGLRSDGTVVATSFIGDYNEGQSEVSDWTDIVAIAAGDWHTVGLRSDGTVVAVGDNDEGQCDVSDWTDIRLPR